MHEQDMISLLQQHDERGMDALLLHCGPLMRYIIAPILPDPQDREECLSEVHPEDGFARITHEEISHHLGTTREVISRELEGMRQMGLLQTGRGKIYVLDRAALEGMANL